MSDASKPANGTRKKKTPTAFKRPGGESMFSSVIAGADEVVANSFIAQGSPAPPGPPAMFRAPAPAAPPPTAPVQAPAPASEPTAAPARTSAQLGTEPLAAPPAEPVQDPAPEPELEPAAATTQPPAALAPLPAPVVHVPDDPPSVPVPLAPAVEIPPVAGPAAAAVPHQPRSAAEQDPATATPSAAPRAPAPRRRASRRPGGLWAHQAVTESFADSVISSNTWITLGFRIVPEILNAVKVRLAADRRSSGNPKLAVGHYLDAALRNAPTEVGDQVASAQAFLTQRMGLVDSGRQSTYRVGPQAQALATSLNAALQEADHARKGIFVVSAALESLLLSLDAEGELPSPGMFAREG